MGERTVDKCAISTAFPEAGHWPGYPGSLRADVALRVPHPMR